MRANWHEVFKIEVSDYIKNEEMCCKMEEKKSEISENE